MEAEQQRRKRIGIRNPHAKAVATDAIARAMDWNVRAYGKLACEEDAEFFAAEAVKALEERYRLVPRAPTERQP